MDRNALLMACKAEFLSAFMRSAEQAMAHAKLSVFRKADFSASPSQRRLLHDANRILHEQQPALRRHFQRSMEQLLNRSFQTAYSTFRPSFSREFNSNSLSLVDATHFEDQLRADEITTRFRDAAGQQLHDLDLRIAILFEQGTIRERENPFRPWLFTRAISSAGEALGARAEVVSLLSAHVAGHLEESIAVIYRHVNDLLAEHGISAQLQLQKPGRPIGVGAPLAAGLLRNARDGAASGSGLPPAAQTAAQVHAAGAAPGETMRRFLAGESAMRTFGTSEPDARIMPNFGSLVDRSVSTALAAALQGLMATSLQAGAAPGQPACNPVLEQRGLLRGATADVSEQMTIDVVAMLFEFILHDEVLPADVRVQLGRLQCLILHIALQESTLLTDPLHPARMLINRIGSIAVGLHGTGVRRERLLAAITQVIDSLLAGDAASSAVFSTSAGGFESRVADEWRGDARVAPAVQVIKDAQRRLARFTDTGARLENAMAGRSIDGFLRDFLATTWLHVIEAAERTTPAALQCRHVVPDLLWSALPSASPESRTQLLAMLPGLVRTIRDGLALLGWDAARMQPVLEWLADAHRNAMRAAADPAQPPPSLASLRRDFADFTSVRDVDASALAAQVPNAVLREFFLNQATRHANARPRVRAAEGRIAADAAARPGVVDAAGPSPIVVQLDAAMIEGETLPALDGGGEALIDTALRDRLRTGASIILKLHDTVSTAQLAWMDRDGSMLLLAADGQPAPLLLDLRRLRQLYAAGKFRFVERSPLFERAIESVRQSAAAA